MYIIDLKHNAALFDLHYETDNKEVAELIFTSRAEVTFKQTIGNFTLTLTNESLDILAIMSRQNL